VHPSACGLGVQVPPAGAEVIAGSYNPQVACAHATACANPGSPIGNSAAFGIQRLSGLPTSFTGYLSGVRLYLTDYDAPTLTAGTNSLVAWHRTGTGTLTATATDSGLGAKTINFTHTDITGQTINTSLTSPCRGDRNDRCPASWNPARPSLSQSVAYNIDTLPEGVDRYGVQAIDRVDRPSSPTAEGAYNFFLTPAIKVDRTPPTVTPSGQLFDLHDQYINGQGTRALTITASDALAGIASLDLEDIGHGIIAHQTIACTPLQCPLQATQSFNVDTSQMAEGRHDLRVIATDQAGNTTTSPWTILIDRTPPTPPSAFAAAFDPASGETDVTYSASDIAAGIARYETTYQLGGGPQISVVTLDPLVTVPGTVAGQAVSVVTVAVDGAGNRSAAGTANLISATADGDDVDGEDRSGVADTLGIDLPETDGTSAGPLLAAASPALSTACTAGTTDKYDVYPQDTFRIHFSGRGTTASGDFYYQYHIHYQVRVAFRGNVSRTTLEAHRTLPNGDTTQVLFDDSNTRIGRPGVFKSYYAHFLRVKVQPGTVISYRGHFDFKTPLQLSPTTRQLGGNYTGSCVARLR